MDVPLVDGLERRLRAARFAKIETNPILVAVQRGDRPAGAFGPALLQYTLLPGVIAELLARGVVKLYRWQSVRDELLRNLGEELGGRSDGQTHFAILCQGFEREVGLTPNTVSATRATDTFIDSLRGLISDRSHHEAAGALFALEDSAVPELRVVARLLNTYAEAAVGHSVIAEDTLGKRVPEAGPWTLDRFLAAHIGDFEVGHRDFLSEALSPYVKSQEDVELLERGFETTLQLMETWWDALSVA